MVSGLSPNVLEAEINKVEHQRGTLQNLPERKLLIDKCVLGTPMWEDKFMQTSIANTYNAKILVFRIRFALFKKQVKYILQTLRPFHIKLLE